MLMHPLIINRQQFHYHYLDSMETTTKRRKILDELMVLIKHFILIHIIISSFFLTDPKGLKIWKIGENDKLVKDLELTIRYLRLTLTIKSLELRFRLFCFHINSMKIQLKLKIFSQIYSTRFPMTSSTTSYHFWIAAHLSSFPSSTNIFAV